MTSYYYDPILKTFRKHDNPPLSQVVQRHTIKEDSAPMPDRLGLNFTGTVAVADNVPSNQTDVDITALPEEGDATWNSLQADATLRLEGANQTNLFVADAANDRVGVGTSAPTARLDVVELDGNPGVGTCTARINRNYSTPVAGDETVLRLGVSGIDATELVAVDTGVGPGTDSAVVIRVRDSGGTMTQALRIHPTDGIDIGVGLSFVKGGTNIIAADGLMMVGQYVRLQGDYRFSRISTSAIDMVLSNAPIELTFATFKTGIWKQCYSAGTLHFDFTTGTGVLGGSEVAKVNDSMWYLYGCSTSAGGASSGLFASQKTDPTTITFPTGYTYYTPRALFAFRVDASGNIVDFIHSPGGWTRYKSLQMALSAGFATSATAIDLSKYVPDIDGTEIECRYRSKHAGSTERYTQLLRDATNAFATQEGLGTATSGLQKIQNAQVNFQLHSGGAAASLYYLTSGALTGTGAGVKLQVTGFKLP